VKRVILFLFSLIFAASVFAQKTDPIKIEPISGSKIEVSTSLSGSIILKIDNFYYNFKGTERDDFIRFLDVHTTLIDSAIALGFEDEYPYKVLSYNIDTTSSISSSILLRESGTFIELYFQNKGSWGIVKLSKENLTAIKNAFAASYSSNKELLEKQLSLQKFIIEAQNKFKTGS